MRLSVLLGLLPMVMAAPTASTKRSEPAPLLTPRAEPENLIADKYIVKFKDGSSLAAVDSAMSILSDAPAAVYKHAFQGFAAELDEATLEALRDHPDVDYIEQDSIITVEGFVTQQGATWGITRLSHRARGATGYTYDDSAGSGTCAYIVDTGIDATHPDFGGRARFVANFAGGQNTDVNGHGTHVAGTIGSNTYGVAKKTQIFGVKVLGDDGSGSTSGIIQGMDFVVSDSRGRSCPRGVVANMSLGGGYSASLNNAATSLVNNNVFLGIAAGNDNKDAANTSPASATAACTVGATDSSDRRSTFSNYGAVVDIFAPGTNILSTWPGGRTNTISGTSMATPHIVGLAAYLAGLEGFPGSQALCNRIRALATSNAISGIPSGTVNLLAFNGNPSG